MASSGSSGRAGSGFQSFDFGSDDVLCSYDDYAGQDNSNGKRSDPTRKDFHEMGRPLVNIYEQEDCSKEEMINAVEKCMKKYADNLLQFLEGISGRMSQLELYCCKIERSIGEFRSDVIRDQNKAEMKFRSLEKHLQEVQSSVQILRDKQELAKTQKELAKLQLGQKESTQKNEEVVVPSSSETKQHDDKPDVANRQLALALPHQTVTQASALHPMHQPEPMQQGRYILNQSGTYYPQRQSLRQDQQGQPLQPELQYVQQRPQIQDFPVQAPQQQSQIVNQTQQPYPQYQQQWPQQPHQFSQQVVQPQKPVSQAQIGPQAPPPSYPPCPPQPANPAVPESYPGSMAMQVPYTTISQPVGSHPEAVPFGYGRPGSAVSQPLPQHISQRQPQPPTSQSSFGPPLNKGGYAGPASYTPPSNAQSYSTMYSYPPSNVSAAQNLQLPPSNVGGVHHPGLQLMRAQPYGEMIEKAASMGYARDHAATVIQRMVESGQPINLNSLLDRLNGQAGGASPRVWSGQQM